MKDLVRRLLREILTNKPPWVLPGKRDPLIEFFLPGRNIAAN